MSVVAFLLVLALTIAQYLWTGADAAGDTLERGMYLLVVTVLVDSVWLILKALFNWMREREWRRELKSRQREWRDEWTALQ